MLYNYHRTPRSRKPNRIKSLRRKANWTHVQIVLSPKQEPNSPIKSWYTQAKDNDPWPWYRRWTAPYRLRKACQNSSQIGLHIKITSEIRPPSKPATTITRKWLHDVWSKPKIRALHPAGIDTKEPSVVIPRKSAIKTGPHRQHHNALHYHDNVWVKVLRRIYFTKIQSKNNLSWHLEVSCLIKTLSITITSKSAIPRSTT